MQDIVKQILISMLDSRETNVYSKLNSV